MIVPAFLVDQKCLDNWQLTTSFMTWCGWFLCYFMTDEADKSSGVESSCWIGMWLLCDRSYHYEVQRDINISKEAIIRLQWIYLSIVGFVFWAFTMRTQFSLSHYAHNMRPEPESCQLCNFLNLWFCDREREREWLHLSNGQQNPIILLPPPTPLHTHHTTPPQYFHACELELRGSKNKSPFLLPHVLPSRNVVAALETARLERACSHSSPPHPSLSD